MPRNKKRTRSWVMEGKDTKSERVKRKKEKKTRSTVPSPISARTGTKKNALAKEEEATNLTTDEDEASRSTTTE
jgi:hypothetical protein